MASLVYCLKWLQLSSISTLAIQVATGVAFYIGLAWLFKMKSYIYIIRIIKEATSKTRMNKA
jgi:hypothetical protein